MIKFPQLLLLCVSCLQMSCLSTFRQGETQRYSVGKNTGIEASREVRPDGTEFSYLVVDGNEADSFRQAANAVKWGLTTSALKDIARTVGSAITDNNAIDSAESVQRARITATENIETTELTAP